MKTNNYKVIHFIITSIDPEVPVWVIIQSSLCNAYTYFFNAPLSSNYY